MNLSKFLSKFRFCLTNSRDIATIVKLIYQSKKYNRLYHKKAIRNSYAESIRYKFRFRGKSVDVYMRTETGDINMFYEIFWSDMYNIPESLLAAPLNIIDLGANVGFTTMYFALKYPDAKIISLEPSKMNFVVLQKNIALQKNVKALNAAVWFESKQIPFMEAANAYNSRIAETDTEHSHTIEAYNVEDILSKENIDTIDLLKIDIEGAEKDILQKNQDWLNKVKNIIIEIHEPYSFSDLQEDLAKYGFTIMNPPDKGLKMLFATRILNEGVH
jgi:FkbM family methyltransferase